MRRADEDKSPLKYASKTINFEKKVLEQLENIAKREGTSVSKLMNFTARKNVINELKFHTDMALFHEQERAKHEFLRNQLYESMIIKKHLKTGMEAEQ